MQNQSGLWLPKVKYKTDINEDTEIDKTKLYQIFKRNKQLKQQTLT